VWPKDENKILIENGADAINNNVSPDEIGAIEKQKSEQTLEMWKMMREQPLTYPESVRAGT